MVHIGKSGPMQTVQADVEQKPVDGFCHGTIVGDRWILTDGVCCHDFWSGTPAATTSVGLEI